MLSQITKTTMAKHLVSKPVSSTMCLQPTFPASFPVTEDPLSLQPETKQLFLPMILLNSMCLAKLPLAPKLCHDQEERQYLPSVLSHAPPSAECGWSCGSLELISISNTVALETAVVGSSPSCSCPQDQAEQLKDRFGEAIFKTYF